MLIGLALILAFLFLIAMGILIIVLVIGSLIMFLPATLVALAVLILTGSWLWAGLAFLVVAIIMVLFK